MDLTYVFCPNILGMLGLSILLVFIRLDFHLESKKLNMFSLAAIVNIVIIFLEVTDYMLGDATFQYAYLLRRITSATGFALSPIFPLILTNISRMSKLSRWIYIPAAVNIIISYASIFTGHLFLIDQWNSCYRGPLFIVMLIISFFYMLLLIYTSFKNLNSMRTGESVFLICVAVIIIIGNLLEIYKYFHFLIWNSCAVLLLCYYLFLHIQYLKYDPLTKAFNRSVYISELKKLKNIDNVGVIFFDLDNLKEINDRDGHECGDAYIIASSNMMKQCFSDVGYLYRIGGDEFVVLISGTTEDIICKKVKEFQNNCIQNEISVSCGYSFCHSAVDLDRMIRYADEAMYENKRIRKQNR